MGKILMAGRFGGLDGKFLYWASSDDYRRDASALRINGL